MDHNARDPMRYHSAVDRKRYYTELEAQLRENGPIKLTQLDPPIVLVTTPGWNRLTDQALQFALRLSPDVVAVHLGALGRPGCRRKEANAPPALG
jgi:hypothetical protein